MAKKLKFEDGERVLCFHGPLLYEAKVINGEENTKSNSKDKAPKYLIHYSGWNKNWDEWVPESRVLKYNDANMQKQKDLLVAHGTGKTRRGGRIPKKEDRESSVLPPQEKTPKQKAKDKEAAANAAEKNAEKDEQKKRRVRVDANVETEEEFQAKIDIRVRIPDELKHWLVDDWDFVTRQEKLYQLPARVPIEDIFADYLKQKLSVKGITPNKESQIREVVNGIREYFNAMLPKQLLYPFEKHQHAEIMSQHPDSTPSHIYGAVHLLRLFTKIGGALAYTQLNEDTISLITANIYEFQKFMAKSAQALFSTNDYVAAPADYQKKGLN